MLTLRRAHPANPFLVPFLIGVFWLVVLVAIVLLSGCATGTGGSECATAEALLTEVRGYLEKAREGLRLCQAVSSECDGALATLGTVETEFFTVQASVDFFCRFGRNEAPRVELEDAREAVARAKAAVGK